MQSIQTFAPVERETLLLAGDIPALGHKEAGELARTELARFIALAETLSDEEWARPTMCTAWSVRDILAHQAGAYASFASWAEFRRQVLTNPYARQEKQSVDGINRRQLEDRQGRSPAVLLDELRELGPRAIATRQKLPGFLRAIPIPFGPPLGTMPLGYLTDNIYVRDTWMHRGDYCVATGRAMELTAAHDGRITALVVRDLEKILRPAVRERGFVLELAGPAGGIWQIGPRPAVTIAMDALDFHILASDRAGAEDMVATGKAGFSGDADFGRKILELISVPY
jgi:uncharacterized protein (TIGR03083 family)